MPDRVIRNLLATPSPAQPLYNLGNALAKQEKWSEAIEAYRQALKISPNYKIYFALGIALETCGEIADALECYSKVLELQPDFVEAQKKLENLTHSTFQKQFSPSRISPHSSEVKIALEKAKTSLDAGEWQEAIDLCERALKIQPNAAEIHAILGNAFYGKRELDGAKRAYLKALELQPNRADIQANLGSVYAQLKEPEAAIECYRQATQLDKNQPLVYSNWGRLLLKLERFEEAAGCYQKAIDLDGSFVKAYLGLADVRSRQNLWLEAVEAYQAATQLDSNSDRAAYGLGVTLIQQDRIDEAIVSIQKSIELNPNLGRSYYQLGNAFVKKNQWEKAEASYRRAIELDPSLVWAYSFLADILIRQERWEEAIACYEKTIELEPNIHVSVYKNLGEALERVQNGEFTDKVDLHRWPYVTTETHPFPKTLPNGRPWPKISIVTPSFNQGEFVEETILSVINQQYPHVEHIFIDGGSTDDTMEIVARYADHFHFIVSKPDRGQSHALNKGFARATGEILTWLNSDDRLAPGALYAAALAFYTSQADVIAGVCQVFQGKQEVLHHVTSSAPGRMSLTDILNVENCWLSGKFFHQPEVLFTRALWEKTGGAVDESLYYSMDYEMWARFAAAGAHICPITHPIAQFRMHEAQKTSTTQKYKPELLATRDRVRDRFEDGMTAAQPSSPSPESSSKLSPKRDRLRVVLLSDIGFSGGAGIAHEQVGRALAAAGHQVIPVAGVSGWEPQPIEFSAGRALQLIASLEPDLVVVGNLHNIQESVELLEGVSQKYPTIFVMHDRWLLTGRCAYVGSCDKYNHSCDRTCPTFDRYPALAPDEIQPTFERKRQLLVGNDNLLLLGNSQWTMNWAREALRSSLSDTVSDRGQDLLETRIQKMTLGIDLDTFRPREKQNCRQRLGLPTDRFIILTGSTSIEDERKGGRHLIEALKIASLENILLVAFGYGSSQIEGINCEIQHVGFIQNRNLLAYYYSAADLFVGASLEEAFGLTFVEAAACGTPAVGYAVGGVPEAICDRITGRLARETRPDALAETIAELYRDREQLERLSRSAPIHVASHFSIYSSYQSLVVALDRVNWLDRLQIAPISKFGVTPPQLSPSLCVKYLANNHIDDKILEGKEIKGCLFAGFGALESPYPDLNLAGYSRWALSPESKFVLETQEPQQGHLLLAYRNVCPSQVLEVWEEDRLLLKTLVDRSEIRQENVLTFPVRIKSGLNFFTLKTHQTTEDSSRRKLAVLVEKIKFFPDLNWYELGSTEIGETTEKTIVMDGTLQGTGWFPWENVDGVAVRWMERVGSAIISGIDVTQPLDIRVEGRAAVAPQLLENLTLKVNGNSIVGEIQPQEDGSWQLLARVPSKMLTPQAPFVLSLHSPEVCQLSPQDHRRASVLVEEIFIQAVDVELEPPNETVILMDETLLGTGWFPSEEREGVAVRWMEKVGSVVVEGVDTTQPLQVRVRGMAVREEHLLETLQVKVNGHLVKGDIERRSNGEWQFEGQVPVEVLPQNMPFLLTLEASEVQRLSAEDERSVSLLVASIIFE
ncbi:MAG: tetratricopeptide repeat protein [Cyanobacteriota bacterium]|nr:tetratricopeptide repeat protein [Cyanobacteriota bacterium]